MQDQPTAIIIPFPGRARTVEQPQMAAAIVPLVEPEVPVATVPQVRRNPQELVSSSERLTQALSNLSVALIDQREATLRWKTAIEDLAGKMRSLGEMGLAEKKLG